MKTIRLFVVAFLAMFFGASFGNRAAAQTDNEFLKQMMEAYISMDEDELREAGIVSYDINTDGSVFVFNILLDEDVTNVVAMDELMNLAKKRAATEDIFSYEDYETIEQMESLGISFRYIVRGNRTGKRVVCDFTMREFYAFEKLFAGEGGLSDEMSVDDIVVLLDKSFAAEDETLHCVRKGNIVYLEQEVTPSEYEDIEHAMDETPVLMKTMMQGALTSDPSAAEVLRMITRKGYRIAYSVRCGNRQPIIINLDL